MATMKKAIAMVIVAFVILMSIPAYGTVLKEETVNSRAVWDCQNDNEYTMTFKTMTFESEYTGDKVVIEFTTEEDIETTFAMKSVRVRDENSNEYMMDLYLIKYTNVATNVEDFLEVSFDEYAEEYSRINECNDDEWYEKIWNFVTFWD